jgi:ABC-type uncharacterized transport system permease subunit
MLTPILSTLVSFVAAISYGLGSLFQRQNLTSDHQDRKRVYASGLVAVITHLAVILLITLRPEGIDFGFFKVASLISWVIVVAVLMSSWKKPLDNLFLYLFPLAIICLLSSIFIPSTYQPQTNYTAGVALHILLGILSVSIITIAAFQTLLISFLNRLLKEKRSFALVSHLPPLETMEALLFEMLWLGLLLLTGVLLTGVIFMEDFFGQHLSHKAVLSTISWGVFAILLWGRHQLGWRGRTANRWILTGFTFLILAYFGSKFVLEIILDRV